MNEPTLFNAEDYERFDPPWGSGPMPLSMFPQDKREEIEFLASRPAPPPKWLNLGLYQIVSRAWYEWHLRRGRDPRERLLRESIPPSLKAAVLERDGYVCQLCGLKVEPEDLHLDHRHPVSKGGRTTLDNLQVAHSTCNLRKGARVLEEVA